MEKKETNKVKEDKKKTVLPMYEALKNAQAEMPTVYKDKTNPRFRSKYASLDSVLECVKTLNKHGFVVSQTTSFINEKFILTSQVKYLTGEVALESQFPLDLSGDMQQIGGRMTYIKKYSLTSMLALSADEDLDGNDAIPQAITDRELKTLESLLATLSPSFKTKLLANARITKLADIKQSDLPKIINWLNANIKKEGAANV